MAASLKQLVQKAFKEIDIDQVTTQELETVSSEIITTRTAKLEEQLEKLLKEKKTLNAQLRKNTKRYKRKNMRFLIA